MSAWNWDGERRRFSPLAIIGMVIGGIAFAALFGFLFGWIVMLLWNWLMPTIFGLPRIGYWQGWGLVLLAHILIKPGYPNSGRHGHGGHRDDRPHNDAWKARMRARFGRGCKDQDTAGGQTTGEDMNGQGADKSSAP